MTTRVMFLGDTHGDLDHVERAMDLAFRRGADAVFQVGDWGFHWPDNDKLEVLYYTAIEHQMPLYWIDGNHDWHPEIRRRYPRRDLRLNTTQVIDVDVHHVRRGCSLTIVGDYGSTMRIVGMGGAPSIDKHRRTEGKTWWPEEEITPDDVDEALGRNNETPVDVVATHDAPGFPPGFGRTGDPAFDALSSVSMGHVREVLTGLRPALHVHGHWHKKYQGKFLNVPVVGLAANFSKLEDSCLVVTKHDDGSVTW